MVLRYYLQTDFGRLHARNPEIQALAEALDRTPSSIAMKGSNYASLDPEITSTGRKGLDQASKLDREVWEFMQTAMEGFEKESAEAAANFGLDPGSMVSVRGGADSIASEINDLELPKNVETETETTISARRRQSFFRRVVLAAYSNRCAISNIALPSLLNASHIIPWSADQSRRIDPSNGIALNVLHDRAFDRGLISFDDDFKVLVSSRLKKTSMSVQASMMLADIHGLQANRPTRFGPDSATLEYHRDMIFKP